MRRVALNGSFVLCVHVVTINFLKPGYNVQLLQCAQHRCKSYEYETIFGLESEVLFSDADALLDLLVHFRFRERARRCRSTFVIMTLFFACGHSAKRRETVNPDADAVSVSSLFISNPILHRIFI